MDTSDNAVVASINVGQSVGVAISHDGADLYVTYYKSADFVSVIDTATLSVIGTINVGSIAEYPAIVDLPPHVTGSLLNDTGISATDKITNDATLTGSKRAAALNYSPAHAANVVTKSSNQRRTLLSGVRLAEQGSATTRAVVEILQPTGSVDELAVSGAVGCFAV